MDFESIFVHALFAKQKWRKALFNLLLHKSIPPWGNSQQPKWNKNEGIFFFHSDIHYLYRAEASFQKHLDKDQLSWLHLALKILLFKNWLVWIQDPFIKWTWPFHRFKLPPTDMVFSYHIYTTTVCVCSLCAKINYLNMKQNKKKFLHKIQKLEINLFFSLTFLPIHEMIFYYTEMIW